MFKTIEERHDEEDVQVGSPVKLSDSKPQVSSSEWDKSIESENSKAEPADTSTLPMLVNPDGNIPNPNTGKINKLMTLSVMLNDQVN